MKSKHAQLGMYPKLPKKPIPASGQNTDGTLEFSLVMTESEKEDDNKVKIKKLVYYYERIGRQIINEKANRLDKNFKLAFGIIDPTDYVKENVERQAEIEMLDGESLDFDLHFYPIIPNIVNSMTNELGKHYINYSAIAVNSEASNQVIDQKNQMLRQMLIQPLQEQFDAQLSEQGITPESQPDVFQQKQELFRQMPQVQKYFKKEYRLEIEKWANHQLKIDDKRFGIPALEKESLFNRITNDQPFVHVNLMEGDYKIENIDPRYAYYLKSPGLQDTSEAVMFGWEENLSPVDLITRYGSKLREEDVDKLEHLHIHSSGTPLLTLDSKARYNIDTPGIIESAQNYLAFREIRENNIPNSKYRGGEYKERLVRVTNMYLQVPRKIAKLTMKSGENSAPVSSIVDDTYKVTIKPVYDQTVLKEKSARTLVFGEHIEWFYINETWRVIKINLSTNPNPDNSDDIWITLEKYPIQLASIGRQFGSYIPVHGGPTGNKYGNSVTIVDKCKPWQVDFNFVHNRNNQKLKGEIGKFYAMNQNVIPQESMGEEWGVGNMIKFATAARDVTIVGVDTSLSNAGQTNMGITGGYGQVVDLTVTEEVLQKAKLAEYFKAECLQVVGISPQFVADISPNETATGISQGINRSILAIKGIYDDHFSTWQKVRQTSLEVAKYLAIQGDMVEQIYVNDEGEREVFQIPSDAMLHQLCIFVDGSMDTNIIIENIKNNVLQDNTLGADSLDKVAISSAKSLSEIYSKLRELRDEREKRENEMQQQQAQQQQQMIESQERQLQAKLKFDADQNELDRQSNERIAQTKVVGQSEFKSGDGGIDELIKLKAIQDKESNRYRELLNNATESAYQRQQTGLQGQQSSKEASDKNDLEKQKIELGREKILADLQKSKNDVLIAKVNKNN